MDLSSFLWGYLGRAAPWAPFKAVGWPQMLEDKANCEYVAVAGVVQAGWVAPLSPCLQAEWGYL